MLYFCLTMYILLGFISFIPFYFVIAYFFIRPLIQPLSNQHYLLFNTIPIASSMIIFVVNSIIIHRLKYKTKIKLPRILFPIIITLFGFISLIYTHDIKESISHVAKYCIIIGLYVIISYNATSYKNIRNMFIGITLSSLIPLLYGIYQRFILNIPRSGSLLADYNEYGIYISLMIIINIYILLNMNKNFSFRILFYFIFILQIASFILSLNRGSWIALTISLIFSIILFYKKLPITKIIVTSIIVVIFSSGIIIQRMGELNKLNEAGYSQDTFKGRIDTWIILLKKVNINPITGYGIGTASSIDLHGIQIAPHNDYVRMSYDLGWFGGFVYFLFLLAPCYRSLFNRKDKDKWSLSFVSFTSGVYFFVISGFQNPAYSFINVPLYLFLTSLPHYTLDPEHDEQKSGLPL